MLPEVQANRFNIIVTPGGVAEIVKFFGLRREYVFTHDARLLNEHNIAEDELAKIRLSSGFDAKKHVQATRRVLETYEEVPQKYKKSEKHPTT